MIKSQMSVLVAIFRIFFYQNSFTGSTLNISFYPFQKSNLSKSQRIHIYPAYYIPLRDPFTSWLLFILFFHEYIHGYSYLLTGQLTQMCHCGSIILSAIIVFLWGWQIVQNELFSEKTLFYITKSIILIYVYTRVG